MDRGWNTDILVALYKDIFLILLPTIALICNCNNYLIHRERIRQDVNKFLGIYRVRILFESIICHFPKLFLRACRRSSDLVMVISRQEVTAGIVTQSKKCRPNIYACMYVHTHTHIYIYIYIYWMRYTRTTRRVSLKKRVCLLSVYNTHRRSKIARWWSHFVKHKISSMHPAFN